MIRSASFLKIQKTQQNEFGQNERFINNRFVRNGKIHSRINPNPINGFANESKRKCETEQEQKATATISVVSH